MYNIEFTGSFFDIQKLPKPGIPEIAVCGRSNVGKSSFINSFCNRKNVAKTSSVPGKTRSLNFYLINNSFYFVDLPGFGYAKVSKGERDYWSKMIDQYFSSRNNVSLAVHLIDSRHKPTDLDIMLNEYLEMTSLPYIVLLNKSDKLNQSEMAASRRFAAEMLPDRIWGENMLFYSSVKKTGVREIREKLSELLKK